MASGRVSTDAFLEEQHLYNTFTPMPENCQKNTN